MDAATPYLLSVASQTRFEDVVLVSACSVIERVAESTSKIGESDRALQTSFALTLRALTQVIASSPSADLERRLWHLSASLVDHIIEYDM